MSNLQQDGMMEAYFHIHPYGSRLGPPGRWWVKYTDEPLPVGTACFICRYIRRIQPTKNCALCGGSRRLPMERAAMLKMGMSVICWCSYCRHHPESQVTVKLERKRPDD